MKRDCLEGAGNRRPGGVRRAADPVRAVDVPHNVRMAPPEVAVRRGSDIRSRDSAARTGPIRKLIGRFPDAKFDAPPRRRGGGDGAGGARLAGVEARQDT